MRTKTLTKAGVAAGALVLLASTAAMAGPPTYLTVNGVGSPSAIADFNGANSGALQLESDYAVQLGCTTSGLTGKAYRGYLVDAGMPIGRITGFTGPNTACRATALSFPVTISQIGSWNIDVKNTPASPGDPVDVEISNMSIRFNGGIPCTFDATATRVDAKLYPGPTGGHDARLVIDSGWGYPLEVAGISTTCGGEIQGGDRLRIKGTYDLDTTGAITGPISHG